MNIRGWLRGDDIRVGETRSLPRPDNELPLLGSYTPSSITPIQALGIGDVYAAVRCLSDAASSLPLPGRRRPNERSSTGLAYSRPNAFASMTAVPVVFQIR